MKILLRQINVGILLLIISLVGCENGNNKAASQIGSKTSLTLPFYGEPTFTPNWLTPGSQKLKDFHRISSFDLINQNGKAINHQTFENKIYVTNYFFATCPGICPKMMDNMAKIQDEFLEDESVLFMSHTAMPEKDSVAVLKKYATNIGAVSDKWHLVTGDRVHMYKLGRKDYFIEEDLGLEQEPDDFLHTENLVLIDQHKHLRGIYNGLNKTAIAQLIKDIQTLKKEK